MNRLTSVFTAIFYLLTHKPHLPIFHLLSSYIFSPTLPKGVLTGEERYYPHQGTPIHRTSYSLSLKSLNQAKTQTRSPRGVPKTPFVIGTNIHIKNPQTNKNKQNTPNNNKKTSRTKKNQKNQHHKKTQTKQKPENLTAKLLHKQQL